MVIEAPSKAEPVVAASQTNTASVVSAPDVLQVLSAPALTASPRSAMREGISDREGVLMGNRTKDLAGIVSAGARLADEHSGKLSARRRVSA